MLCCGTPGLSHRLLVPVPFPEAPSKSLSQSITLPFACTDIGTRRIQLSQRVKSHYLQLCAQAHLFLERNKEVCWKGTLEVCSQPPAHGTAKWDQVAQCGATSSPILNICKDGESTASLGNLWKGLANLMMKKPFLASNCLSFVWGFSSCHYATLRRFVSVFTISLPPLGSSRQ